jgi:hypothetical protein
MKYKIQTNKNKTRYDWKATRENIRKSMEQHYKKMADAGEIRPAEYAMTMVFGVDEELAAAKRWVRRQRSI